MHAILLAAGRGRRLGSDHPKCLLEIGGKTLLEHHVDHLAKAGVDGLTVVVGFQKEEVIAALEPLKGRLPIDTVENPDFVHGSIVSLHVAGDRLEGGAVWMDADVYYPTALLEKLVHSSNENCVLLDARSEEQGEEMMLGVKEGCVRAIARRVGTDWDLVGESVGFAKAGPTAGKTLRELLRTEVEAGRLDQEYEAAMNMLFQRHPVGFERVDEFEWTEIDFPEDVDKAQAIAAR